MIQHKNLAESGWQKLTLAEQLGNIGGETNRALRWLDKDDKIYQDCLTRALELLDLTIRDPRWRGRLKELLRVREFLCDSFFAGEEYASRLEDLDHYFLEFALAARLGK